MYTSIKQQLYKQDIECFYDLITLLDETFGGVSSGNMRLMYGTAQPTVIVEEEVSDENPELDKPETELIEGGEVQEEQHEVDDDPKKTLDKYDVFKKKNIDVDKIISEVPHNVGTTLPYIDVDSDYVIKDNENKETVKIVGEDDDASSILGGMMQDRASLKKNNENFLDVDKQVAQIDEEKLAEVNAKPEEAEEKSENEQSSSDNEEVLDSLLSLDQFEVAENSQTEKDENKQEEQKEDKSETEVVEAELEKIEPEIVPEPVVPKEPETFEVVENNEMSDEDKESIAIAVNNFKTKKSKLASGGVVIERNQPIARRERTVQYDQPQVTQEPVTPEAPQEYYGTSNEIRQLDINENTDSILSSIKNSAAASYDQSYQGYADPYANQGYSNQMYGYQGGYMQNNAGYANPYGAQQNPYAGYQNNAYQQTPNYQGVNQNPYNQDFSAYQEPESNTAVEVDFGDSSESVQKAKPAKKVRSKEDEPRPRNLRKKSEANAMEETTQVAKTRGRPKKQEVSESMVIKSDKEFDEVLSRAEKLMRKSEEGLSASQSKRIEKELKMLMDAMNRYKESK